MVFLYHATAVIDVVLNLLLKQIVRLNTIDKHRRATLLQEQATFLYSPLISDSLINAWVVNAKGLLMSLKILAISPSYKHIAHFVFAGLRINSSHFGLVYRSR